MHALLSMRFTNARRGMMLLIVLSLLSMFLMLGTLLIVNTSRSRLTARAFAAATAMTACQWSGTAHMTASTSDRASTSRKSL